MQPPLSTFNWRLPERTGAWPSGRECARPNASNVLPRLPIEAKYVNMADINSTTRSRPSELRTSGEPAQPRERPTGELVAMVELLFFAYRDFTAEPDQILAELGFGRAHHRVLHFVNRNPGLRVADLLEILRITKQSLARVLKQLIDEGFISQTQPETDRRERRLHVTEKGRVLANRLLALQTERLGHALGMAGPDARKIAERFLTAVIDPADRDEVRRLIAGDASNGTAVEGGGS